MAGFEWVYNLSGGRPLIQVLVAKDTETLTKYDMLNLESGEVDLAVTTDTAIIGALVGPEDPGDATVGQPGKVACTDSTTKLKVITNPDAVYEATDANARNVGATLDISGATGAQALATSANTEFVVVARKNQSTDKTLVMIIHDLHPFNATGL